MRIGVNFQTSDKYLSGVEYFAVGLMRALLEYEPKNEYVVFTNRPDVLANHVAESANLTVYHAKYPPSRLGRIAWEHFCLPRLASRHGLDVLHCPSYICPVFPSKSKYVVTIHDTLAIDRPDWCKPSNTAYYKLAMSAGCRRAGAVTVVSWQTAKDVSRCLGVSPEKIKVIYPGIDEIFHERLDHNRLQSIKDRYGLPDEYILYVGNVEPKKNLESLLAATQQLADRGLPHSLVMVGKRSWKARGVLKSVRLLQDQGRLVSAGYVSREDLPGLYQRANAYVCTSHFEGFGFPPLEAMASGIPVLASQGGALRETLGEAAFVIDPCDPTQIADALVAILTDEALRQDHVAKGLARAEYFDWRTTAGLLLELYRELAA